MKTIRISGIISNFEWEEEENVSSKTLKASLDAAGGEDLLITINSPGGSVFEGLEMFSLIKNYPGNVETRVVSLAASMGSILALAGNTKSIESTALYFIHNAQGGGYGDYRDLSKVSVWLKDVSELLANIYADNTDLNLKEAKKIMDNEAQFFGASLEALGFEVVDTDTDINESTARVESIARIKACKDRMSEEDIKDDLEKVAASIAGDKFQTVPRVGKPTNQTTNIKPADNGKNKKEIISMDKEKLKAEFPATYNAIFDAGKAEAMDQVTAHLTMGEASGSLELAVKNIKEGNGFTQTVQAEYQAAGMKNQDISNRNDDDGQTPDTDGSGTADAEGEVTDADTEAYTDKLNKKMGVK